MSQRIPQCSACRDEGHWGPDSQPPVQSHTCSTKGPKTKKAILKMVSSTAKEVYFSLGTGWPGGNYTAKEELDHLIYRLAVLENKRVT